MEYYLAIKKNTFKSVLLPRKTQPGRLQSMGSLESDTTERLHFHFSLWRRKWQPTPVFLPGESPGREAWWAAVYGVTQSWTRLKQHSSSSSSICWWTSRLLPCPGYYKQCCDEHWGTRVSFNSGFLSVYVQQWDCWVIKQFYFQFLKESPHLSP